MSPRWAVLISQLTLMAAVLFGQWEMWRLQHQLNDSIAANIEATRVFRTLPPACKTSMSLPPGGRCMIIITMPGETDDL